MKTPNQKELKFLEYYFKLGNATEAARRVGFKTPEQSGYKILKRPHIQEWVSRYQAKSPEIKIPSKGQLIDHIMNIIKAPENQTVQLRALDMILKVIPNGYAPTQSQNQNINLNKTSLTIDHLKQLTIEELENLLTE